jgi:excisionase family DNA binding protein
VAPPKIKGPKMEKFQSDILTVDEAAALLKIPRSSVYKLAQQGKIPAQKVGRHWRFYRPKLVKWVAGELAFTMNENSEE